MNTNISAHADNMVEAGTRTNQQSGNKKKKTVFIDGQAGTTGSVSYTHLPHSEFPHE